MHDHILVVDDDPEIRHLLKSFLEKNGYQVSTAAEGNGMWRTLEQVHIDLIVLDLMLPGTDGLELCRSLRARSRVPVIMLTARGDEMDRILGLEMGADDYLAKPFSARELMARIKVVLRRVREIPVDPLAVVVTTHEIAARFARKFRYFNTFGGNPVSAAVGLAVLDVIERENILEHVAEVGAHLAGGLNRLAQHHEWIGEVR